MTELNPSPIDLDQPVENPALLAEEFVQLKAKAERASSLEQARKERPLTKEEDAFLAGMPAVYRRAVEVTRILRRTNTGPAKVKPPSKRVQKKAEAEAKAAKFLDF